MLWPPLSLLLRRRWLEEPGGGSCVWEILAPSAVADPEAALGVPGLEGEERPEVMLSLDALIRALGPRSPAPPQQMDDLAGAAEIVVQGT